MDFPLARTGLQLRYLGATIPFIFILIALGTAPWQAALLGLAAWLLSSRGYAGKELTTDFTQVRDYYDLLGWRCGRWRAMPAIVGVTVKRYSVLQSDMPAVMGWGNWKNATRRREELVIMLSVPDSRQGLIVGRTAVAELTATTEAAQRLAAHLGVPLNSYL